MAKDKVSVLFAGLVFAGAWVMLWGAAYFSRGEDDANWLLLPAIVSLIVFLVIAVMWSIVSTMALTDKHDWSK